MRNRTNTRLCISAVMCALVLVIGVAGPAGAHRQVKSDPRDAAGPLDIVRMVVRHNQTNIIATVRMEQAWRSRVVRGDYSRYVYVGLDPQGGANDYGYAVMIKFRNGRLHAFVERVLTDFSRQRVGEASVSRPSSRAVKIIVPRSMIRASGDWVRWGVQTNVGSDYDRAPNRGGGTYYHGL